MASQITCITKPDPHNSHEACIRADHRDYVEADVASAAACLADYVKLTM
jgi:hypothetical protein